MPREGKQNRSGKAAVLEPDELQHLLAELDDPYRAIAQICYLTAGRIGEVLLLKAEHVTGGLSVVPCSEYQDEGVTDGKGHSTDGESVGTGQTCIVLSLPQLWQEWSHHGSCC